MSISMRLLLTVALLIPASGWCQEAKPDPWAPVRFLEGEWRGTTTGNPGEGTVSRSYEFVLGGKYLHEKNTSTYPVQEKNKKGEVHQHWSFMSFDRQRKTIVFRQFHVEGFVNQYVYVPEKSTASRLVFESEIFENLSNKWGARETYEVLGPNEVVEIFELAPPDNPFEVYSTNRLKRAGS